MSSSSLTGKLEVDIEIKASPEKFHDMLANKPHQLHHICNDKIQGCDLHEGEVGKVGIILSWHYMFDGKVKVVKIVVEEIDFVKNLVTFRLIDGDLMKDYKSFVCTIQALSKSEGGGNVVHLTLVYEKLHDGIANPEALLQLLRAVYEDIDAHLTQENEKMD